MRSTDEQMFERGPAEDIRSRILVAHFYGAMDAGAAGRLAVGEMLRSLPFERVATFDADQFIDYRSHRPIVTVKDWTTESMETPELVLDRVKDDLGNPILVLHGPEPDAKWETFARIIGEFVAEAGVEITVSFHGVPSGVPHTRPTPVHVQATDASLVPAQPKMATTMQFPAPATTFLQNRLAESGVNGIALLAAVPFYMSDTGYPAGASALLSSLSDFADLSLPVGELEQGAHEDQGTIAQLIEQNPEILQTVSALEEHYDAWTGEGSGVPLGALGQRENLEKTRKESKDIGDVIEAYLANLEAEAEPEPEEAEPESGPADEDPLAAALRRVELRRKDPEAAARLRAPLHRAPGDGIDEAGAANPDGPAEDAPGEDGAPGDDRDVADGTRKDHEGGFEASRDASD